MKHMAKILTAWILVFVLCFSCLSVFAEDASQQESPTYKDSDYVKNIARTIALMGRYEGLVENNLYLVALEAIFQKHPELYEDAVRAMIGSVDENSVYYNSDETKGFLESLDDEIVGIGVTVISQNGNLVVTQPSPGSPAEKAGIKTGDIIVSANGVVLTNMPLDDAVEHIRGSEGTTVRLEVKRSGVASTLIIEIVRQTIVTPPLDFEVVEQDGKKAAKIKIYAFTENVAEHFKEALDKVDASGTKNLIIDLRDNGGGYLEQAVAIADMLLPEGKVIVNEDYKLDEFDVQYRSTGKSRQYNIIILVNGMSASASEVLTAALVENEAAIALGEKTYGKGTVQSAYSAPKNAIMKLTVAYYTTPLGNNIHKKGIRPHAVVKNTTKPVDMSEFDYFTFAKNYTLGDRGADILNAKKMLEMMGAYYGEINDVFDENLVSAINIFQQSMGAQPNGMLDMTTQMNLYNELSKLQVEVDNQLEAAMDSF